MKICLISRYATLKGAGLGRVAARLYAGLRARGHDVIMIHDGKSLAAYWWYTVVRKPFLLPKGMDIYHALSPVESFWLPERNSIVTVHDLFPVLYEDFQGAGIGANKVRQRIAGEFFAHSLFKSAMCARVICDSTLTATQYLRYVDGFAKRADVVYLGISSELRPLNLTALKRPRIGYLGQLDRRKRIDVLIDSFKRSKFDGELMIAGTGTDEAMLRVQAAGDDRISFMGFLPDSKLPLFYSSLTALILPSYVEGWGLPAVEAMACGTPVVILQDGVIPYEVRLHCMEARDLRECFDAIADGLVLERNENVDWARSHTWERCVSEYEKVYREVANGTV